MFLVRFFCRQLKADKRNKRRRAVRQVVYTVGHHRYSSGQCAHYYFACAKKRVQYKPDYSRKPPVFFADARIGHVVVIFNKYFCKKSEHFLLPSYAHMEITAVFGVFQNKSENTSALLIFMTRATNLSPVLGKILARKFIPCASNPVTFLRFLR